MTKATETLREWLNSRLDWPLWAVSLSLFQALVVSVLEAVLMAKVLYFLQDAFSPNTSGSTPFVAVYFALFLIAIWFQLVSAVDAYVFRNSIQVIAVFVFNVFTVVYSFVQVFQINNLKTCINDYADIFSTPLSRTPAFAVALYPQVWALERDQSRLCTFTTLRRPSNSSSLEPVSATFRPEVIAANISTYKREFDTALGLAYTIIAIMVCCNVLCGYLSYKTFGVYGWSIYQIQGADISKREILRRYHIFLTLMKTNVYFALGVVGQMAMSIYFSTKVQIVEYDPKGQLHAGLAEQRMRLWIYGLLVAATSLFYFVVGYFGMRHANMLLMSVFLLMMVIYMAGLCFFVYLANTNVEEYRITRIWLTIFCELAVCVAWHVVG
ncbi:hypothetical protein BC831DRAFT_470167 [Entophlyctis helioformis]|nr:hypothetical protein BC831DRAFT_470167 [Entophlyctis helioformis]